MQTALNSNNNTVQVYSDGKLVSYIININNNTVAANSSSTLCTVNAAYKPLYVASNWSIGTNNCHFGVLENCQVTMYNHTNSSRNGGWTTITVPLKVPLY